MAHLNSPHDLQYWWVPKHRIGPLLLPLCHCKDNTGSPAVQLCNSALYLNESGSVMALLELRLLWLVWSNWKKRTDWPCFYIAPHAWHFGVTVAWNPVGRPCVPVAWKQWVSTEELPPLSLSLILCLKHSISPLWSEVYYRAKVCTFFPNACLCKAAHGYYTYGTHYFHHM